MERRPSLRLQGFDYATPGAYFVTLCEKKRRCVFGHIIDQVMHLSDLGIMMKEAWFETATIRKEVRLDEYCVMPNHFHGIFWITENGQLPLLEHTLLPQTPGYQNSFGPQHKNLSTLVNKLKGAVTRRAWQAGHGDFGWQRGSNDRIIRNNEEYNAIVHYIRQNPSRWEEDEWYTP
ncbi:MAG: transposase [Bacteroidia bacterium]|nr:transposase [Bacteroidia bacterium]